MLESAMAEANGHRGVVGGRRGVLEAVEARKRLLKHAGGWGGGGEAGGRRGELEVIGACWRSPGCAGGCWGEQEVTGVCWRSSNVVDAIGASKR